MESIHHRRKQERKKEFSHVSLLSLSGIGIETACLGGFATNWCMGGWNGNLSSFFFELMMMAHGTNTRVEILHCWRQRDGVGMI